MNNIKLLIYCKKLGYQVFELMNNKIHIPIEFKFEGNYYSDYIYIFLNEDNEIDGIGEISLINKYNLEKRTVLFYADGKFSTVKFTEISPEKNKEKFGNVFLIIDEYLEDKFRFLIASYLCLKSKFPVCLSKYILTDFILLYGFY